MIAKPGTPWYEVYSRCSSMSPEEISALLGFSLAYCRFVREAWNEVHDANGAR